MAVTVNNYLVVSHIPIVIQNGTLVISYSPGQIFSAPSNNESVVQQLQLGNIVLTGQSVSSAALILDSELANQYIFANGTRSFTGSQSMGGNYLTNLLDPGSAQDAATKNYVDTHSGGSVPANQLATTGAPVTINTSAPPVTGDILVATSATAASWQAVLNLFVMTNGTVPLTAAWNVGGFNLQNLANPVNPQDAVTKTYVDTADGNFLNKNGSVALTADWNVGDFHLLSLLDPTTAQGAATKNYVDNHIGTAGSLATTGSPVVVSTAAPPTTGQVLTATSATAADWQTPSAGSLTLAQTLSNGNLTGNTNIIGTNGSSNQEFVLDSTNGNFSLPLSSSTTGRINWSSTTAANGTADTGIGRLAAGALQVTNGGDPTSSASAAKLTASGIDAINTSDGNGRAFQSGGNGGFSPGILLTNNSCVVAWSSSASSFTALDTGLSRVSAGVLAVGDGTASDTTGSLLGANLLASSGAASTSSTSGYVGTQSGSGVPTGTPATTFTGSVPLYVNISAGTIYGYFSSSWNSLSGSGSTLTSVVAAGNELTDTQTIIWSSTSSPSGSADTGIGRYAAGVLLATNSGTPTNPANAASLIGANLFASSGASSTSSTTGYVGTQGGAGTPTGTPALSFTGSVPLYVNTSAGTIYGYYSSAWNSLSGSGDTLTSIVAAGNELTDVQTIAWSSTSSATGPADSGIGRIGTNELAVTQGGAPSLSALGNLVVNDLVLIAPGTPNNTSLFLQGNSGGASGGGAVSLSQLSLVTWATSNQASGTATLGLSLASGGGAVLAVGDGTNQDTTGTILAANLLASSGAASTSSTSGYAGTQGGAGAPTGTPAVTFTGSIPLYVNTSAGTIYGYYSSAWTSLSGSGGGSGTLTSVVATGNELTDTQTIVWSSTSSPTGTADTAIGRYAANQVGFFDGGGTATSNLAGIYLNNIFYYDNTNSEVGVLISGGTGHGGGVTGVDMAHNGGYYFGSAGADGTMDTGIMRKGAALLSISSGPSSSTGEDGSVICANFVATSGAASTTSTTGYVATQGGAGAPTGIPAVTASGSVQLYVNTSTGAIYGYYGSTWNALT
jgi:hypothetical protein